MNKSVETTANAAPVTPTPIPERYESESGRVYSERPIAFAYLQPEDVARRIGGKLNFIDQETAILEDTTGEATLSFLTDEHGETHGSIRVGLGRDDYKLDDTAVLLGEEAVTFVAKGRYLPHANDDRVFEWFRLTRAGISHHIERVNKFTPKGEMTGDIWNAAYDPSLRRRTRA